MTLRAWNAIGPRCTSVSAVELVTASLQGSSGGLNAVPSGEASSIARFAVDADVRLPVRRRR
ncbi:MAG TPA: hypothetical protein VIR59_11370, partial [Gaiellaceae bacterium]